MTPRPSPMDLVVVVLFGRGEGNKCVLLGEGDKFLFLGEGGGGKSSRVVFLGGGGGAEQSCFFGRGGAQRMSSRIVFFWEGGGRKLSGRFVFGEGGDVGSICLFYYSPTAESFGVSAQIGSGVVRGDPELRFHQGSTRVPPGFHQGSTRVPPGFHQGSTRFCKGCGVVRGGLR